MAAQGKEITLLNVCYDPTRELYQATTLPSRSIGRRKPGDTVTIQQSHGGSGKQARSVIDGLPADVVTLALAYDMDAICGESEASCRRLGRSACRTTARRTPRRLCSSCAREIRNGIKDWDDLVKPGVSVIHAQSRRLRAAARWNYLAAWGYALKKPGGDEAQGAGFRGPPLQERARAGHRRARRDDDVRPARHWRRAGRVGERSAAGA